MGEKYSTKICTYHKLMNNRHYYFILINCYLYLTNTITETFSTWQMNVSLFPETEGYKEIKNSSLIPLDHNFVRFS